MTPNEVFERIAARAHEPRLRHVEGVCQFEVEGEAWSIGVHHGDIVVARGRSEEATALLRTSARALERLAAGTDHETLLTAAMRGALEAEGDVLGCAWVVTLFPVPERS